MMKRIVMGLTGVLLFSGSLWALTPQQLKEKMSQGTTLTIIDVRNTQHYTEGHIPGAINIPATVIGKKRLPPLGEVVVYGDGIRSDIPEKAATELNSKNGIKAAVLDGGLPAWESLQMPTTQPSGLSRKNTRFLSYQELTETVGVNRDILLVDMRGETKNDRGKTRTVLEEKFPGVRSIRVEGKKRLNNSALDVTEIVRGIGGGGNARHYLCVLIDNGDGNAEEVAQRLHAAGFARVAILTGGEEALSSEGAPKQVIKMDSAAVPAKK